MVYNTAFTWCVLTNWMVSFVKNVRYTWIKDRVCSITNKGGWTIVWLYTVCTVYLIHSAFIYEIYNPGVRWIYLCYTVCDIEMGKKPIVVPTGSLLPVTGCKKMWIVQHISDVIVKYSSLLWVRFLLFRATNDKCWGLYVGYPHSSSE